MLTSKHAHQRDRILRAGRTALALAIAAFAAVPVLADWAGVQQLDPDSSADAAPTTDEDR